MVDIQRYKDLLLRHSPIIHLSKYGNDGDGSGEDWCRPANISWWLNLNNQIPLDQGEYPFELYGAVVRFKEENQEIILTPEPLTSFEEILPFEHKKGDIVYYADARKIFNERRSIEEMLKLAESPFELVPLCRRVGSKKFKKARKMRHGIYGGDLGYIPYLFRKEEGGERQEEILKKNISPDGKPRPGDWMMYGIVKNRSEYIQLQYWLFYPHNDSVSLGFYAFDHEGDWEHIRVTLDSEEEIFSCFISAHEGGTLYKREDGELRSADSVLKFQDGHPIVYAADGSHAHYDRVGKFHIFCCDQTNEEGPVWDDGGGANLTWLYFEDEYNDQVIYNNDETWQFFSGKFGKHTRSPQSPYVKNKLKTYLEAGEAPV
ncbi:MAG: hypothetical protein DRP41_03520 [Thermodesulfobacteriota bacterium]|nr:MAG: hypothetical protein DRP41_03520 [Thermodesulfobacteriota bacterium]